MTTTDHPILTEFRKVFREVLGYMPRDLAADIDDDAEKDHMSALIYGQAARGPFRWKFTVQNQGVMTEDEWGKYMRDLYRKWIRMQVGEKPRYERKVRK